MNRRGVIGERIAAAYLRCKGFSLVERNYRSRFGEIDVIMRRGDTVLFVEVKTRGKDPLGTPAEAVDFYKQKRLIKTAEFYIIERRLGDVDIRFDVVEVELYRFHLRVRHIENAF